MLLIPKVSSAANRWYEPAQLQLAYDQGSMTGAHLAQLLLDRSGFQGLFALRSLIRDGKATTDQEWIPAMLTLLKAAIGLKYGEWRMEEATQNISQSPLFFQLPPAQPLTFPPQSSASDAPSLNVFTRVDLQKWRKVVADRIEQESLVNQEHAALLDRVEQSTLSLLRQVLLGTYNNGLTVPSVAEALSDRFLFDFSDSPSNKVSRVAQAIATIQRLLQGLRSGDLFRYKTSATAAAYPNVRLEAEHFDSEWQWLGSYGSWRSALFIFMYPENLLYPTLRAKTEQSEVFQSIVRSAQAASPTTKEQIIDFAQKYHDYFSDINNLEIQAACTTRIARVTGTDLYQQNPQEEDLIFSFAIAKSRNTAYWCVRKKKFLNDDSQTMWKQIPFSEKVIKLKGAVPFFTKTGEHYISLFAFVFPKRGSAIKFKTLRINLSKFDQSNPWDESATELDVPTQQTVVPVPVFDTVAVEQIAASESTLGNQICRPPRVYLAKLTANTAISNLSGTTTILLKELSEDGLDWGRNVLLTRFHCLVRWFLDFQPTTLSVNLTLAITLSFPANLLESSGGLTTFIEGVGPVSRQLSATWPNGPFRQ